MKKTTALLALIVPLAATAAPAADVGFALLGGANQSWAEVTGPLAFDTEGETRFALGASVALRMSHGFSFEPGVFWSEAQFVSNDFDPQARISSRVFLLPLPFKRHWNAEGAIAPHLLAGPQLAFIGRTRQTFGGLEEDVSDDVRDFDVEVLLGGGLGLRAGRGRATMELRYSIGLRNLDETENDIKIRSLQLLLGYQF
jgi:hypothetical protein